MKEGQSENEMRAEWEADEEILVGQRQVSTFPLNGKGKHQQGRAATRAGWLINWLALASAWKGEQAGAGTSRKAPPKMVALQGTEVGKG